MASDPNQCAVGPDGELLSPDQIQWFHDPDDPHPLPQQPPARDSLSVPTSLTLHRNGSMSSIGSSTSAASSANLDHRPPATVVAGVRRTTRLHKPSARLLQNLSPQGTGPRSRALGKRKANSSPEPERNLDLDGAGVDSSDVDAGHLKKLRLADTDESGMDDSEDVPPLVTHVDSDDEDGYEGGDADADGDDNDNDDEVDEEAAEIAYQQTKAFGDADREGINARTSKAEARRDILTIFVDEDIEIQGKKKRASWCTLCREKGVKKNLCYFTGGVSSLRTHISRITGHFEVYKVRCEAKNIKIHHRAIPRGQKDNLIQTNLDTAVPSKPRATPFSSSGLLDYIVELVVTQDDAFRLVDKGPFHRLLQYCRPSLSESDIPHCTKVREEILQRAGVAEARIREKFKSLPCQISFTFDTWTSKSNQPYLGITGHYIDAPADRPHQWELKSEQLAYTPLEGNHSGANMAKIIARTIERYEIKDKVGWFTADNASNNDTAMRALGDIIDPFEDRWDPIKRRVRCMEHAIHLCAGHFISELSPTSVSAIIKKMRKYKSSVDAEEVEESDEDGDEEEDDNDDTPFTSGDAIGKGLALVKQIRKSPQALAFLKKMCKEVGIEALQLLGWVRTRWASLFNFLDRFRTLKKAVNRFVQLADDSDEVPTLKNKKYSDFKLTAQEWGMIDKMHEVLQEPANAQQSFSASRYPSAWRTIPVLEFLRESWTNLANHPSFSAEITQAIQSGLDNIDKWYQKTDDTEVYFVCLALNPNIKTAYAEDKWDKKFFDAGMLQLEAVFDSYSLVVQPTSVPTTMARNATTGLMSQGPTNTADSSKVFRQYGHSWMKDAVKARRNQDNTSTNPRAELIAYLAAPLEDDIEDVVAWWGIHGAQYPTLARIARDYLAIQGSAVASERAFSSGALTATLRRNRLTPIMFEALQILKGAYRNGHMSAEKDVLARIVDSLNAEFGIDEDPDF